MKMIVKGVNVLACQYIYKGIDEIPNSVIVLADKYALNYEIKNGNMCIYGQNDLHFRPIKRLSSMAMMKVLELISGAVSSATKFEIAIKYERLRKTYVSTWTAEERLQQFNEDKIRMENIK
jgi:hypothetical protein